MKPSSPTPRHCAIYTRKSTDHNLDLAFNSLDAQREACEAFIRSQAHEGWKLIHDRYDDGAFSGVSLDRPALQQMLDHVRARRIDIIVVHKIDRLTRSLADFAKLVELFDDHEVSFVSVTQSFNTTSSMGRLTLNVLLSFAQFEREVIGERVRDKIAASKRKGIWVGGPVPLGYRVIDKKPHVMPLEAESVRLIFETYLQCGSIKTLAQALNHMGIKPRRRLLSNGRTLAADRFMPGALAYLLKNRFYIGEIVYKGEIYPGMQEAILNRDLFEAVQARLAMQKVERKLQQTRSPSILIGRIYDDRGNLMAPSHANKKGVRYRYYLSRALLEGRSEEAGSVSRVSAPDVERAACEALRKAKGMYVELSDREVIDQNLMRIIVGRKDLQIELRPPPEDHPDRSAEILTVPFEAFRLPRKGVAHAASTTNAMSAETRQSLLQAIVRSRAWMKHIRENPAADLRELAASRNIAERHLRFLLVLSFLSPRIILAIADGTAPAHLTATNLARSLPHRWSEQERILLAV